MKKGYDVDYGWYCVSFASQSTAVLSDGYGPMWGGLSVVNEYRKESASTTERTLVVENGKPNGGVDLKGRLKNGNYWRLFGFGWETIGYKDVSENAANYFDSIIDNVCYRELN